MVRSTFAALGSFNTFREGHNDPAWLFPLFPQESSVRVPKGNLAVLVRTTSPPSFEQYRSILVSVSFDCSDALRSRCPSDATE